MGKGGVFICYRREDSGPYVGRIRDHLHAHLGSARVFRDLDSIGPGEDFVRAMRRGIRNARVVLVVIGPYWLDIEDDRGDRVLDSPGDYVRTEIQTALNEGRYVLPVLVGSATMPLPEELPREIAPLAHRNAVVVDDSRFEHDIEQLLKAIRRPASHQSRGPRAVARPRRGRPGKVLLLLLFAVAGAFGGVASLESIDHEHILDAWMPHYWLACGLSLLAITWALSRLRRTHVFLAAILGAGTTLGFAILLYGT